MKNQVLGIGLLLFSSSAFAQDYLKVTIREISNESMVGGFNPDFLPTPTPSPTPSINPNLPTNDPVFDPYSSPTQKKGDIDIDKLILLGEKVWDFVLSNKPSADYEIFKTSVVPEGITSWTQLKMWAKPVSKIYRVEFKNLMGQSAGGFDYRITYFYNGSFNDKGKFIGQISVVPTNIKLKTDRTMKLRAELASVINFGTETDPVAGAHLILSWTSPTTTRYEMQSAEYMIYGTGEIDDLTNGN